MHINAETNHTLAQSGLMHQAHRKIFVSFVSSW